MLQVNLLPDVKKELLHAKRMRNLVMTVCIFVSIGAAAIVVVMGLVMGGLAIKKNITAGQVDQNIAKINDQKTKNRLDEYLSVQNNLSQINAIKESQPQLSRVMGYLDVVFGRTTPINGLHWTDWQSIKLLAGGPGAGASASPTGGVGIELTGETDTDLARFMLRNRLYYAMVKYSEYTVAGSGKVTEGETKTDQKLFPKMVPVVDFETSTQDDTTGRWPFKATLVFNPIVFGIKYRIQAVTIDNCKVWSATYGTIGEGCQEDSGTDAGGAATGDAANQNGGGSQ